MKLSSLVDLAAHIDRKRWETETGGMDFGGVRLRTDETSQSKIQGLKQLFDADPARPPADWQAQPGVWVQVDGQTITAIGLAVGDHVQACFSRSRQVHEARVAGLVTTVAQVDAAFADVSAPWTA